MKIGPKCRGRKEAGDHSVKAGSNGGPFARKLSAHESRPDHAKVFSQLSKVPAFTAKNAHLHSRLNYWIDLAGHRENQR